MDETIALRVNDIACNDLQDVPVVTVVVLQKTNVARTKEIVTRIRIVWKD